MLSPGVQAFAVLKLILNFSKTTAQRRVLFNSVNLVGTIQQSVFMFMFKS